MNLALLVLRLVVGVLFMGHGAQKLFGWFGGGGIDGTASFFEQAGLRPGRLHAYAGGLGEFGGGLLLALGLLSPLAAAVLIGVMTAAILSVHLKNGIWATKQGYEYNLVLIAVAFAVAGLGAGKWSLDDALGLDDAGTVWALAALAAGLVGGLGAIASGRMQHPAPPPAHHTTGGAH
jgi:putative oxidoreductase